MGMNTITLGTQSNIDLGDSNSLQLIWVSPATTTIGSPDSELRREPEEREFQIEFRSGYWLASHLTTVGQWNAVMEQKLDGPEDLPATKISWHDAEKFCSILTTRYVDVLPEGFAFSLPSEAQWEHACRAGSRTRYHSGDSTEDLERVAWVGTNSGGTLKPVGQKLPNDWGFFDMHGNVAEWCFDDFGEYPKQNVVDHINTISVGQEPLKSVRSANAKHPVDGVFRSAARGYGFPNEGSPFTGFRVAVRRIQNAHHAESPIVSSIEWGKIEVDGFGTMKDAKLFPQGAREWNWNETNTRHVPGIQIADVQELLDHGARIVVLSKGMELALRTCPKTIEYLKNKDIQVYSEESNFAVELYNKLAERGEPVGALIHSTC